jgi:hypothetical protein
MRKHIYKQKRILLLLSMILFLIVIPFHSFSNSDNLVDADSKNLRFYGMVITEEANNEEMIQIKRLLDDEYRVANWFVGSNYVTFDTTDNLREVEKKYGQYGIIEDLTNIEYHLD